VNGFYQAKEGFLHGCRDIARELILEGACPKDIVPIYIEEDGAESD
jgi:hypothetical protein